MLRKFAKKLISIAMALALMLPAAITPLAAATDVQGHWAEETLREWIDLGVLNGDGAGVYRPDDGATRAEFIKLVNSVWGYADASADLSRYTDVSEDAWYYGDVAAAVSAGYLNGTSGSTMSPGAPITREQAITIVSRIEGLSGADTSILSAARDGTDVSPWAAQAVAASIGAGFVTGADGKINPGAGITRAEIVVLLDRVKKDDRVYAFAGTYGPGDGSESVGGSVTVASPGVTLQNLAVAKNLTVAASVGEGDAHINGVTVKGDVYVEGGGGNSLYLADFRVEGSMIVRKYEGENKVRIVVSGESNFTVVILETGAVLMTQELADGVKINVEIPAEFLDGSEFEFIGDFDNIVNNGKDADITVTGSVNKLTLNESASVGGEGKIVTAEVSAEAGEGTSFETAPVSVTGDGKGDVTLPAQTTPGSNTGTPGGTPSTPPTTQYTVASVAPLTPEVAHNGTYTLPPSVTATLNNGSTKSFAVVWTPATADTSACGVFEFTGALTMETNYTNPNGITASLTLTVTPVLSSIAITQLPAKTLYLVGDELDIAGLVVTGAYSDGSTGALTVSAGDITDFDSDAAAAQQTLTVTVEGKTATFNIAIYAAVESGELVSVEQPAAATALNGAAPTAAGLNLPSQVAITVDTDGEESGENSVTLADVTWDLEDEDITYNPETKTEQTFNVSGEITLPEDIENTDSVSLEVTISVTVSAAKYTVSFDRNGQPGASVAPQTVTHGEKATAPAAPTSVSHDFIGWYASAVGDGEAWDFSDDEVPGDLTLYAIWEIKTYTVSFAAGTHDPALTGDPELPVSPTVNHGAAATKPADPTLAGYAFAGWYTDAALTTPYIWTTPVTADITLYAKFADTLSQAKDALTFDIIKGTNTSEQGIMTNLALPASLISFPGVAITWTSSNTDVITVNDAIGTVTRPESDAADAEVALTATLSLDGKNTDKTFTLLVRKQGIADIEVEGGDERFAPGYPVVSFDNEGKATVKIKLNPGVATTQNPVVAYLVFSFNTGDDYTLNKDSILYGYSIAKTDGSDDKHSIWNPNSAVEMIITGDDECTHTASAYLSTGMQSHKIGIVMLANDDIYDPDAEATVITLTLTAAEGSYIDEMPPRWMTPYLSANGGTIYAYFDEKLSAAGGNTPEPTDFTLGGNGASGITVTGVTIDNNPDEMSGSLPGCVTLTLNGNITNLENLTLTYTPGNNVIADINSNPVTVAIENADIIAEPPGATAYINPTAGTMSIEFTPGLHYWFISENIGTLSAAVSLKYNNEDVSNLAYSTGWWLSGSWTEIFFTFEPLASGSYSAGDFAFSIATGLKFLNLQTIVVTNETARRVLPEVTTEGITAEYDEVNSRIVLTLPDGTDLTGRSDGASAAACSFTLKLGNTRLLYRQPATSDCPVTDNDNRVYLPLTERLNAAISESGEALTLSYAPYAAHSMQMYTHLSDMTGAFIPAFGTVTVARGS
ncbi:MAG: InlB B-repeat-containing protein [Oscillospiraceae bacterium]|jgi:uncharacterized repeat protein (TIGR02543 family)|nr:InlB B-repeat-containing protein [Oscillospiraceae bacterium]